MQRTLLFKILIIALLMALIAVPLMMIEATISERNQFRNEAVRSIAADSVGEQTLLGPVLVIPYSDVYEDEVVDPDSKKTVLRKFVANRRHYVFPNELQIDSRVDTDQRYRGLHKVLVYSGQHSLNGDFVLPGMAALARQKPNSVLSLAQPYISLGLSDSRGLRNYPKIVWNGQPFEFKQGSQLRSMPKGLHAPIADLELGSATPVKFSLTLAIDGIERLTMLPLAKNNQITIKSPWPHPQFGGRFLPAVKGRVTDENGFAASWNISSLSSNAQQQLLALENVRGVGERATDKEQAIEANPATSVREIDHFSVGFIEPVNIYSQAARAVKYGLLFVALTFAAFFLFEVLKQLPIHPVQYTLVGMALALFFLLLVSLSEHMRFLWAYLLAASACVSLITFYLMFVLGHWQRGFALGAGLTLLYGVLFGLLQSESNALVMGSLLLFVVLSGIMIVTRKVNWYQLNKPLVA
jgi:inner membrane protein